MAATATHPCSMHGGSSASSRRALANHARAAARLPSNVPIASPSRADANAAALTSPAAVKPRTAAERWVMTPSTSICAYAASASANAAAPSTASVPSVPSTPPASRCAANGGRAPDG